MGEGESVRLALAFLALFALVRAIASSPCSSRAMEACAWRGPGWLAAAGGGSRGELKRAAAAAGGGPCALSGWGVGHLAAYAALAFAFPARWAEIWAVGAAWEVAEAYWRVSDPLDLLWNAVGVAAGLAARAALD